MDTNTATPKAPHRIRLVRSILSPKFVRQYGRAAKRLGMPLTTVEEGVAVMQRLQSRGEFVTVSPAGHSERVYYANTEAEAVEFAGRNRTAEERVEIGTLHGKVYRERSL